MKEDIFNLSLSDNDIKIGLEKDLNIDDLLTLNYFKAFPQNTIHNFLKDYPIIATNYKKVKTILNKLIEKNLINKNSTEDIVKMLKSKKNNNYNTGKSKCEWCGIEVLVLHKHHYPIPKCEGGTETVEICPNCHYEFHYLIGK